MLRYVVLFYLAGVASNFISFISDKEFLAEAKEHNRPAGVKATAVLLLCLSSWGMWFLFD